MNKQEMQEIMDKLKPVLKHTMSFNCPSDCSLEDNHEICGTLSNDCQLCWGKAIKKLLFEEE